MTTLMRAADADRERVAGLLRRAHEEGRLDTAELEERLERCYGAKTLAELDVLVNDLPRPREPPPRSRPPLVLAAVVVGILALTVATHGHVLFVWPLLFFVFMRFGRRRPRWR
jgi:hypothetical protein